MLPSFCTETATVIRPGTRTLRGAPVPDWSVAAEHEVAGCLLQQTSSSTDRDGRHALAVDAVLYAPAGADIAAGDRVRIRGEGSVEGEPDAVRSPTGAVDHTEAVLKRWRG